jgi:SPP1 family predicted phage head-tail adaptor
MPDSFDIDPGKLRFRVQIQQNTPTKDPTGQDLENWSMIACRWASIEPASGSHFTATEQIRNDMTHVIAMRYFAGLTPRNRLLYCSRIFNILSVINEWEMDVCHTLLVQEVV